VIGTAHDLWRVRGPAAGATSAPPAVDSAPEGAPGRAAALPRDTAATEAGPRAARDPGVVDLNRADTAELDALPGIGPVLARRIVEYRRQHGPFRRVEELRAVRGVGPRLLERLRARVGVDGGSPAGP
jgi:competence protein ComEA